MELIQTFEMNHRRLGSWAIYELSENEVKKYEHKFVLSNGVYSEQDIQQLGVDTIISRLKKQVGEVLFDTRREACMQAKTIELEARICVLEAFVKMYSKKLDTESKEVESPDLDSTLKSIGINLTGDELLDRMQKAIESADEILVDKKTKDLMGKFKE